MRQIIQIFCVFIFLQVLCGVLGILSIPLDYLRTINNQGMGIFLSIFTVLFYLVVTTIASVIIVDKMEKHKRD